MLKLGNKTAKTNHKKVQLFAKSVKRNFGIKSNLFWKSHCDQINKFVEAHPYHFTPLHSQHNNVTDTDDNSNLVADVDLHTLIRIVRSELKNGKAPGIENVYNDILRKAIGAGFYNILAQATISLTLLPTEGGGGFLARAIRLSAITLEPFHLGSPNFLTSLFYSLDSL